MFSVRYFAFFPVSSTFCLNLIIPNITPGGLFSGGGAYIRKEFQKLVPKCPGANTRWGLLSEFYGNTIQICSGGGTSKVCPLSTIIYIM